MQVTQTQTQTCWHSARRSLASRRSWFNWISRCSKSRAWCVHVWVLCVHVYVWVSCTFCLGYTNIGYVSCVYAWHVNKTISCCLKSWIRRVHVGMCLYMCDKLIVVFTNDLYNYTLETESVIIYICTSMYTCIHTLVCIHKYILSYEYIYTYSRA
jgi:hypothetical protein